MIKDYLKIPFNEVRRRKLRSWLTLIGVIIGIAAVVSLITLGQGLQNAIQGQFDALGNDKLFITAKANTFTPGLTTDSVKITEKDLEVVQSTLGIKRATGSIFSTAKIEFNDQVRYFSIAGFPTDPQDRALLGEAQSFKIGQGRSLQDGDKDKAVLGYSYTQPTLFDKEITTSSKVLIQDVEFKVVGFWERIGSPPDDQSISIPIETYWEIFGQEDEYGFIVAQIQAGEDINQMEEKLSRELRKSRGLSEEEEDLNIETPQQLLGAFTTILDIVQIVLIGIAAISLLVGGIGIMNTMYTTVLERTKEIGVMKAIGAQNKHILALTLVESGFYGLGGGLIGTILGLGFAKAVEAAFILAVGPAFLSVEISLPLIFFALTFSFVVGILSGIAPAWRASKLDPVESLRYE